MFQSVVMGLHYLKFPPCLIVFFFFLEYMLFTVTYWFYNYNYFKYIWLIWIERHGQIFNNKSCIKDGKTNPITRLFLDWTTTISGRHKKQIELLHLNLWQTSTALEQYPLLHTSFSLLASPTILSLFLSFFF